jgi:glutaredoxin
VQTKTALYMASAIVGAAVVAMAGMRAVSMANDRPAHAAIAEPPPPPLVTTEMAPSPSAPALHPTAESTARVPDGPSREERILAEKKRVPVTVYTAAWCGYCRKAKAYMDAHGIAYREQDIETSAAAKARMRAIGGGGLPTFEIDGRVKSGYDPDWIESTIREAAERRVDL